MRKKSLLVNNSSIVSLAKRNPERLTEDDDRTHVRKSAESNLSRRSNQSKNLKVVSIANRFLEEEKMI